MLFRHKILTYISKLNQWSLTLRPKSSVLDPGPDWIRIQSGCRYWICSVINIELYSISKQNQRSLTLRPKSSVSNRDPDWIRIQSGQSIRIQNPNPRGQNPQKLTKVLDVLFWGLKASSEAGTFFIESKFFYSCNFFFFNFWSSKPGIGSAFSLKCWIRIRNIAKIKYKNV
jgi:hypothetical protein